MLLALDTAGPTCAARLEDGNGIVTEIAEPMERGHAERIVPLIGEVLDRAGADFTDLSRIAVTVGPGSFTGLRVGVAAARGLSLALGIPAIGIGVLDALLPDGAAPDALRLAVLPGPRGQNQVHALGADADGATVLPAALIDLDALVDLLEPYPTIVLAGAVAALVMPRLGHRAHIVHTRASADLAVVARLAREGHGASPPVPLYLRPADATPQPRAVARA